MNTTIILISEIIVLGLILTCLIRANLAANRLRQKIEDFNARLKKTLPTVRDIFTLTHQYIEIWKADFLKKVEASGNLLGEFAAYYIMHKIFKKQYESFSTGFNLIKMFF